MIKDQILLEKAYKEVLENSVLKFETRKKLKEVDRENFYEKLGVYKRQNVQTAMTVIEQIFNEYIHSYTSYSTNWHEGVSMAGKYIKRSLKDGTIPSLGDLEKDAILVAFKTDDDDVTFKVEQEILEEALFEKYEDYVRYLEWFTREWKNILLPKDHELSSLFDF